MEESLALLGIGMACVLYLMLVIKPPEVKPPDTSRFPSMPSDEKMNYLIKIGKIHQAELDKKKNKKDPMKDEAKKSLTEMGFSATEAKKVLEDIQAENVEEYIQKAMNKIEI